jgi:Rieske Fe-S protein
VDDVRDPGRRRFTKYALIAGLGAAASAGIGGLIAFLYPRSAPGDAPLRVANDTIPGPGAPPLALAGGSVLLVNLRPGEGVTPRNLDVAGGSPPAPGDARGGLLAMHALCTHLHCNVRWRPDLPFELDGVAYEAFACPCHGARFTKAGVRLFGPAPRSLSTLRVEPDTAFGGGVVIHRGRAQPGGPDNPARALPWPAQG